MAAPCCALPLPRRQRASQCSKLDDETIRAPLRANPHARRPLAQTRDSLYCLTSPTRSCAAVQKAMRDRLLRFALKITAPGVRRVSGDSSPSPIGQVSGDFGTYSISEPDKVLTFNIVRSNGVGAVVLH